MEQAAEEGEQPVWELLYEENEKWEMFRDAKMYLLSNKSDEVRVPVISSQAQKMPLISREGRGGGGRTKNKRLCSTI